LSVNSRIPPPFSNRLSGALANSAGAGRSSPTPSLCGPLFLVRSLCALSLFLVRSRTRVSHLRVFSLPRSLFPSRFLSLSLSLPLVPSRSRPRSHALSLSPLFSHARLPLARVLSFSLSLSLVRSPRDLSLFLATSHSLSLSLSQSRVRPLRRPCHVSRCVMHTWPVPSFRPFRRPSLRTPSRPPRHVASLPGPAGYTPPLDGSR